MDGKLRNMATVYLVRGGQILLLYRQGGRVVNNVWVGSAGGHFEPHELNDARACVLRELHEELGLGESDITDLRLRYITLRHTRGEIRQNYYFFATLQPEVNRPLTSNEGECRWFDFSDVMNLSIPYSARYTLEHYIAEGHLNTHVYVGVDSPAGPVLILLRMDTE